MVSELGVVGQVQARGTGLGLAPACGQHLLPCSLTKDMTGKEDNYRGPAVRALCQITDVSLPHLSCSLFPAQLPLGLILRVL